MEVSYWKMHDYFHGIDSVNSIFSKIEWITNLNTLFYFFQLNREMEIDGQLDVASEVDLFCLHVVAYDLLQRSLQAFKDAWNCHPIRTEHSRSPMELNISGLQKLKEEQENWLLEGEVSELIQVNYFICSIDSYINFIWINLFRERNLSHWQNGPGMAMHSINVSFRNITYKFQWMNCWP